MSDAQTTPPALLGDWPDRPSLTLLMAGQRTRVHYTNWRGETAERTIELDGAVFWGRTEWHPEPQWLVCGMDVERQENRVWAVKDMVPAP